MVSRIQVYQNFQNIRFLVCTRILCIKIFSISKVLVPYQNSGIKSFSTWHANFTCINIFCSPNIFQYTWIKIFRKSKFSVNQNLFKIKIFSISKSWEYQNFQFIKIFIKISSIFKFLVYQIFQHFEFFSVSKMRLWKRESSQKAGICQTHRPHGTVRGLGYFRLKIVWYKHMERAALGRRNALEGVCLTQELTAQWSQT